MSNKFKDIVEKTEELKNSSFINQLILLEDYQQKEITKLLFVDSVIIKENNTDFAIFKLKYQDSQDVEIRVRKDKKNKYLIGIFSDTKNKNNTPDKWLTIGDSDFEDNESITPFKPTPNKQFFDDDYFNNLLKENNLNREKIYECENNKLNISLFDDLVKAMIAIQNFKNDVNDSKEFIKNVLNYLSKHRNETFLNFKIGDKSVEEKVYLIDNNEEYRFHISGKDSAGKQIFIHKAKDTEKTFEIHLKYIKINDKKIEVTDNNKIGRKDIKFNKQQYLQEKNKAGYKDDKFLFKIEFTELKDSVYEKFVENFLKFFRFRLKYYTENKTEKTKTSSTQSKSQNSEDKQKSKDMKNQALNQILYGPPGTGKTYNTINKAVEIIAPNDYKAEKTDEAYKANKAKFDELKNAGQIVFTTFHQNYTYEDFVIGIKPNIDSDKLTFKQNHGIFYKICKKAYDDQNNNYVLIIDEINRANISRVFGELITLLEDDKRIGAEHELIITLPNGESFGVPKNLYIIGTMNTADKSIALIDIALRRRFHFEAKYPDYDLVEDTKKKNFLKIINTKIYAEKKSADWLIGHAYFMKNESLEVIVINKVIPLLMEYFNNNTETVQKVLDNKYTYNSHNDFKWENNQNQDEEKQ